MFEAGKDDALSGVRKKLIGEWKMSATSEDGTAWEGDGTFEIEPEYRKLHLLIDLPARPPMAKKIMDIYDISINPRENPISISYFVDD